MYPECHYCKNANMEPAGNCETIVECPDCHAEVSDAWLRGYWIGVKDATRPAESVDDNSPCNCPAKETCPEFDGDGGCVLLLR